MNEDNLDNITKVHLGSDHAGFEMKEVVKEWLEQNHYEVIDHGAYEFDETDDFPEFIEPVAREVSIDSQSRGIMFGGSGQGEAMLANRFPGIRAAVYYGNPDIMQTDSKGNELNIISSSRQHNNANILSLGARFLEEVEALEAVQLWLETSFSGEERHIRRLEELDQLGS